MDIISLLSTDRIACEQDINSKKRAFEVLADLLTIGQNALTSQKIFNSLIHREKLGSTTVGNGCSIPHAQLPISRPRGAFLSLKKGIQLSAPDRKPIQLFFGLLVPEESTKQATSENLAMLSTLTFLLSRKSVSSQLIRYKNPQIVMNYFDTNVPIKQAA